MDTTDKWSAKGQLISLFERSNGDDGQWSEAWVDDGKSGYFLVEIPADACDELREQLVHGAELEVVGSMPASGVPEIEEVTVGGRSWSSDDGVPVSHGFLDGHNLLMQAIAPIAHLDRGV